MQTIERKTRTRFMNPLYIYINDSFQLRFANVHKFDDDGNSYIAHLHIDGEDPGFYFVIGDRHMNYMPLPGHKESFFIKNYFVKKYDSRHQMFLQACNKYNADTIIKYHVLSNEDDIKELLNKGNKYVFITNENTTEGIELLTIK
jgi:hypothetical protein